jgi:hypothetical protein
VKNMIYKSKSYRLSDKVLKKIDNRKKDFKSYNLLFEHLLGIKK